MPGRQQSGPDTRVLGDTPCSQLRGATEASRSYRRTNSDGVAVSWQVVRTLFTTLFEAVWLTPLAVGFAALWVKRARALFVGVVAATWAAALCWLIVGWPLSLQLAGCDGLVNPPWAFVLLPVSAAVGVAIGWLVWRSARGTAVSLMRTVLFLLFLLPALFMAHVGTWMQAAQQGGSCRKGNVTQSLSMTGLLPDRSP